MKRLTLFVAAALALLAPASAAAKGPSTATISGPGLSSPLSIAGVGEGDTSTDLGVLVMEGGWFAQVFDQAPSPILRSQPQNLGPRYTVTYTMPPGGDRLVQSLYPYAARGPVTYMQPGQTFWDGQKTPGGWYRGTVRLKRMLVSAGLPSSPPARSAASHGRRIGVAAGIGVALAAAVLAFRRRH